MAKLSNIVERERSLWKALRFVLVESIRGSKKYSLMRYIFAGIGSALVFIEFGALAIIINEFATHSISEVRIWVLVQGFILLALSDLLPSITQSLHGYSWNVQSDDIQRHLQTLQFNKMRELDIGTIEQPEFQNILQLYSSRGWHSFLSTINILTSSIRESVALIIATVSLAAISPLALLIIFVGAIPTYFFERHHAKISAIIWRQNAEESRIWNNKAFALNNKHALIELKNFGLIKVFLGKFLRAIGKFHTQSKVHEKKRLWSNIFSRLILTIAFGGAFALLIYQVYTGAIIIGSLVFAFSVVSRFQSSINQLFSNIGSLTEHKKNIDTVLDFLETKPMVVPGKKILDPKNPLSIEFRSVSFTYPGGKREVLKDISFRVAPSENIAIVGLNGAGKTTLIKLLTRVYDPTKGTIYVNDVPLVEYDLKSWRSCVGILLQEYSLYSDETVAENIMLGDIMKHDQKLVEASAREVTMHESILAMPKQYRQRVGTEFRGGIELSKGQKQKLALARVLYRNAPLVILDEPTAAIDAVSEDAIFTSIQERHPDQTRIIISHKFSNVRDADQIILIEEGVIIEQGNHEKLMKKNGTYAELFNLQAKGYQ